MIIFIYGQDNYRVRETLQKTITQLKNKLSDKVNLTRFNFEDESSNSLKDFEDSCKTVSLFKEKKITVLGNVFLSSSSNEVLEILKKWDLAKDREIAVVFYETLGEKELVKKDKALFGFLTKESSTSKELLTLEGKKLENWVVNQFQETGITIESKSLAKLIDVISTNEQNETNFTWHLKQEIDKLIASSTSKTLTEKEITDLVITDREEEIFPIIDALANKEHARAFALLYKAISNGMDPSYVFSMIIYQFRNLLCIKDMASSPISAGLPSAEIAKQSGIHPFVVRKTLEQARKFELEELKTKFNKLAKIEFSTKNGLSDLTDELYNLSFGV